MGVLQRIIFSHTPDEAMSGGLAKACVPGKNCSVPEKIRVPKLKIKRNEKPTFIYERGVWSEKYISFATVGKLEKKMANYRNHLRFTINALEMR